MANQLCKSLSEIASRCSSAIYLAHSTTAWSHNDDLVVRRSVPKPEDETVAPEMKHPQSLEANIVTLKNNGIQEALPHTLLHLEL